jgi:hypothetical protein
MKKTFVFRRPTKSYDVFYVSANTAKEALRLIQEAKADNVEHTDEDTQLPFEFVKTREN